MCFDDGMEVERATRDAAQLFKQLGNESRLQIVRLLAEHPRPVGKLSEATGLSQPLVSQHLRNLRQAALVVGERSGREVTYRLADRHVAHVVEDAVAHSLHTHDPGRKAVAESPSDTALREDTL